MRVIDKHIIHCSDTPNDRNVTTADIREWHTDPKPKGNGWNDIGYHYIILRDGTIERGRPIEKIGAHCYGQNIRSIGTCLIGRDKFTPAQYKSLKSLHKRLNNIYLGIEIFGHRDFTEGKTCPNFNVREIITNKKDVDMFGVLSGKKTYVTGVLGLIAAFAGVLTGDATLAQGAQLGLTALLGIFLRNGIK